jgi:hypothetical protein
MIKRPSNSQIFRNAEGPSVNKSAARPRPIIETLLTGGGFQLPSMIDGLG